MRVIRHIRNWTEVRDYLRTLPHFTEEKTRAGNGRQNFWIPQEPNYATKTYIHAIQDERLWAFLKRLWAEIEIAQVYGGNVGIDWHRDAAYAKPNARIFNLGVCTLESMNEGNLISLPLQGGELIEFNCKHRHRCLNPSPDRYGIGMWSVKIPML